MAMGKEVGGVGERGAGGVKQRISEVLADVTLQGTPPMLTVLPLALKAKDVPAMLSRVPPAVEPLRGETLLTIGVKKSLWVAPGENLAVPRPSATAMERVFQPPGALGRVQVREVSVTAVMLQRELSPGRIFNPSGRSETALSSLRVREAFPSPLPAPWDSRRKFVPVKVTDRPAEGCETPPAKV